MGTAIPSQFTFPGLALNQKIFRLGGAKINDYVIRESKCQYKIVLNSTWVFLREKSSNRFWVNSNKVGKDNT